MTRNLISLVVACCIAAAVFGCNKKDEEVVDPYVEATLREATYGEVVSENNQYKLVNPKVIAGLGDIAVVEQARMAQFVTGNGIAAKLDSLGADAELTFRVVKAYSPVVHFQCVSIQSPTDSLVVAGDKPIAFPRTADALDYVPAETFIDTVMTVFKYNDTEGLRAMIGQKYAFRARLVHEMEDSVMTWFLVGDVQSSWGKYPKLRIRKPRPSMEIVLMLAQRTRQDFVGGVTYADIEPWDFRRVNYVCGTVDIGYIRFLDKVFMR
jgi:hypothetical protein